MLSPVKGCGSRANSCSVWPNGNSAERSTRNRRAVIRLLSCGANQFPHGGITRAVATGNGAKASQNASLVSTFYHCPGLKRSDQRYIYPDTAICRCTRPEFTRRNQHQRHAIPQIFGGSLVPAPIAIDQSLFGNRVGCSRHNVTKFSRYSFQLILPLPQKPIAPVIDNMMQIPLKICANLSKLQGSRSRQRVPSAKDFSGPPRAQIIFDIVCPVGM